MAVSIQGEVEGGRLAGRVADAVESLLARGSIKSSVLLFKYERWRFETTIA